MQKREILAQNGVSSEHEVGTDRTAVWAPVSAQVLVWLRNGNLRYQLQKREILAQYVVSSEHEIGAEIVDKEAL